MSLYQFFKPTMSLPTAEETGLSARTIEEAKKAVKEVLTDQRLTLSSQSSSGKKRKYTTSFIPEIRVGHSIIGLYKVCLAPEGWSNAII